MDSWIDQFFYPESKTAKRFKWCVILLVLGVGAFLFTTSLCSISAFEKACDEGIYVDATITVSHSSNFFSSTDSYTSYLSYVHDGITYSNVFYKSGRSALRNNSDGKVISVLLNPNKPEELAAHMINDFHVFVSEIFFALGLTLAIYGAATENDRFRQKRIAHEQKKYRTATTPDHFRDFSLLLLCILLLINLSMFFAYPYAFGLYAIVSSM